MRYTHERQNYWRQVLAEYYSSGLKPVEFCNQNHLAYKSFSKWRLRLSEELVPVRQSDSADLVLLPLNVPSMTPEQAGLQPPARTYSGVELEINGMTVRVSSGFDGDTLRRVLEITGGLPC